MQQPKVTVIIPTFNRPVFLAEAVMSILNQTCRALEIIIIDNGSGSEHRDEISRIANCHDSINLIRLRSNKGPGYARNIGISKAKGDWILFLDDDDILSSDFIEACFASLAVERNAEMVIGRAVRFTKGLAVSYPRDAMGAIHLESYKKDPITTSLINSVAVGSCLVRKNTIGSLRFKEDIWRGEDTIFWFSLMQKIKVLAIADTAFVGIRQHNNKITLMNNSSHPDGSPALSRERAIKIIIDSMEEQNHWNAFILKIIFKQIADNFRYSPSIIVLLMSNPLYGIRLITLIIKKKLYRYGILPTGKIFKKNINDFTWLQNQ